MILYDLKFWTHLNLRYVCPKTMTEIEKCIIGCTADYDCPKNKICSKKEKGKWSSQNQVDE